MLIDKQIEKIVYGNKVEKYFVNFVYKRQKEKGILDLFKTPEELTYITEEKDNVYFLSESDAVIYAKFANNPSELIDIKIYGYNSWKNELLEKYIVSDMGEAFTETKLNISTLQIEETNYHIICVLKPENDKVFYFFYKDTSSAFGTPWKDRLSSKLQDELVKYSPDIAGKIYDSFESILKAATELSKFHSEQRIKELNAFDRITKENVLKKTVVSTEKLSIGLKNCQLV